MKPQHNLDNARALNELAKVIHQWPGINRRKLWRLHSELSRTAPGVLSSRVINRTGFVGVKRNHRGDFVASVTVGGRRRHVGTFTSPEDAYEARVRLLETMHEQEGE